MDSKTAVLRWRRGQEAAAERIRDLTRAEGPLPERAVSESLAALDTLATMGMWPGPRDPVSESMVEAVRQRWVRIERRARQTPTR
ncbi:MAG: hypothetical protein EXR72_06285 [Myxococcales bacterium]|nr:hypothetical protein [Myxococcales bacterium]